MMHDCFIPNVHVATGWGRSGAVVTVTGGGLGDVSGRVRLK